MHHGKERLGKDSAKPFVFMSSLDMQRGIAESANMASKGEIEMFKLMIRGCMVLAMPVLVASCVVTTPPAEPSPRQCREDNRRSHGEIWQQFQQARAAGRIDPAEQQRFGEMEYRLNRQREMMARDGLSWQECQAMSRDLANMRIEVQRIAASPARDSRVMQCREDNRRSHGEIWQQFQQARAAGRIDPAEQQQFNALEARLHSHRQMLARDGLTLAECLHIGRELDNERVHVLRMAASSSHDPYVRQCRQDNQRAHGEVWQQFQRARSAGHISPAEQQQFSAMEARLNNHRHMLARNGLTLAECQHLGREIARERAEVQRMAASPARDPRVHQCREDNRRAHSEAVNVFYRARSAGQINPMEAQRFRAIEDRLNNHRNMLARDGLTLAECQHLSREIARERAEVENMAATRSAPRR